MCSYVNRAMGNKHAIRLVLTICIFFGNGSSWKLTLKDTSGLSIALQNVEISSTIDKSYTHTIPQVIPSCVCYCGDKDRTCSEPAVSENETIEFRYFNGYDSETPCIMYFMCCHVKVVPSPITYEVVHIGSPVVNIALEINGVSTVLPDSVERLAVGDTLLNINVVRKLPKFLLRPGWYSFSNVTKDMCETKNMNIENEHELQNAGWYQKYMTSKNQKALQSPLEQAFSVNVTTFDPLSYNWKLNATQYFSNSSMINDDQQTFRNCRSNGTKFGNVSLDKLTGRVTMPYPPKYELQVTSLKGRTFIFQATIYITVPFNPKLVVVVKEITGIIVGTVGVDGFSKTVEIVTIFIANASDTVQRVTLLSTSVERQLVCLHPKLRKRETVCAYAEVIECSLFNQSIPEENFTSSHEPNENPSIDNNSNVPIILGVFFCIFVILCATASVIFILKKRNSKHYIRFTNYIHGLISR